MGDKKNIVIIAAVAAIVVIIVLLLFFRPEYDSIDWTDTYANNSQQPYGTQLVFDLLKDGREHRDFISSTGDQIQTVLADSVTGVTNYIFIGNQYYAKQNQIDSILLFVSEGNNVFISSFVEPYVLMDSLTENECEYGLYDYIFETKVDLGVLQDTTMVEFPDYEYVYGWESSEIEWNIYNNLDCYESIQRLGNVDQHPNFIKIPYEKGNFYFHCTPFAFTNFYLRKKSGLDYANLVFDHLPYGNIFWDEHSKDPFNSFEPGSPNYSSQESPLKFILGHVSLKWAWYSLWIITLLFVFFRSKRKQRIIPVYKIPENSSIEYTESIGSLYFQQNDHKKLALLKMKLFLEYIRNHYFLPTHELNNELIDKVTIKAQVEKQKVKEIFDLYKVIFNKADISDLMLSEFHKKIQYFYQHCK